MTSVSLTLMAALVAVQVASGPTLVGTVRDSTGQIIRGAVVIVRSTSVAEQRLVTGSNGTFVVPPAADGELTIIVRANGFAEAQRTLPAGPKPESLEFVLEPATLSDSVTITASRMEQRLKDVPASVSVLTQEDIRYSPAVVADDVLRQIPTFSLFRRMSSLAAHPTTQGVSLRGIGPSGVSRTLVLLDGIPFNDPFGGWVYWTRMPIDAAERVEVVDSSSSSLYGNYAMGGVINVVSTPPARRTLDARALYGSRDSPKVDYRVGDVWGKVGVVLDGAAFRTDGYPIVVETNPAGVQERGRVDKNATVSFNNVNLKVEYTPSDRLHAFFRGGYFREKRVNGKASTIDGTDEKNDTTWKSIGGGVRLRMGTAGDLQGSLFGDIGQFRSNFLAVPAATPPRSIGRMTLNQRVPSDSIGGNAQWSRSFGSTQLVTAGTDFRWVDGDSEEEGLDPTTGTQVVLKRVSGGTQRNLGFFVQDAISVASRLTMTLSARADSWRNYDAHNLEVAWPSGIPTANHNPNLPERDDTVFSPRIAARYQLNDRLSIWGDYGAGFRAPTLNELYRQFRVGTVLTLANFELGPERLVGGDIGATWLPTRNVMVRVTYFDNRVKDPVSNVTLTQSGANVTQQRQNLGRTRIHGIQQDAEVRIGTSWRFTGAYLFEHAKVREFAANPALVGNYLAQVPKHRGSVQAIYSNPRYLTFAVALQAIGLQYDDDLNQRTVPGLSEPGLPGYAVFSMTASRMIVRGIEGFFGVQNMFEKEYFVGLLPTTLGSPRLVTAGVRVRLSGR